MIDESSVQISWVDPDWRELESQQALDTSLVDFIIRFTELEASVEKMFIRELGLTEPSISIILNRISSLEERTKQIATVLKLRNAPDEAQAAFKEVCNKILPLRKKRNKCAHRLRRNRKAQFIATEKDGSTSTLDTKQFDEAIAELRKINFQMWFFADDLEDCKLFEELITEPNTDAKVFFDYRITRGF